jgi:hypothetical protein
MRSGRPAGDRDRSGRTVAAEMMYCVVPVDLEDTVYGDLLWHYRDRPEVVVILDRRTTTLRARIRMTVVVF